MSGKYEVVLKDFAIFGAIYGALVSLLVGLFVVFVLGGALLLMFDIVPGAAGTIVILAFVILGAVMGAISWLINGVVYLVLQKQIYALANKLSKKFIKNTVYWQIVILGLFIALVQGLIFGTDLISFASTTITTLFAAYIMIILTGVFKIKIPLKT